MRVTLQNTNVDFDLKSMDYFSFVALCYATNVSDILFKLGDESVDSSRMIRLQDRKDGVLMNEHLEVNL